MADTPWWDIRPQLSRTADEHARRLNFVWKQIIDPCDAPITVWLWAFWPAFWHLVLQWYTIDITQIFIAYLRPGFRAFKVRSKKHWGSGTRGKRGGSKWSKLNPVNFDPNEFIGNDILGWDEIPMKGPFPGELWFWAIEGVIERAQFLWMVMDLGSAFLYEWTSAVARTQYCHARDDAVLTATAADYPQSGIFGWDPMGILTAVKMRNLTFWNGYGVATNVGPGQILALAGLECIPSGTPNPWAELRVRCVSGPRTGYEMLVHNDFTEGQTQDMAATGPTAGQETWLAEIRVNGLFLIKSPTLQFHATARNP